ncbi:MAG: response regulator, partial [Chromatiales bacterium]|nr:response regulator [Chromatiales bacterium]
MRIGKLRWQNLGFRQQLIFSFCIGVVIAGMISAAAISTLSKAAMNDRFMLDGEKVVQSLAVQSTLSLLYESADNVNDYAETLLSSPDIIGVAVIDLAGMPLLSIGTASDKQIDVSSLSRQQITKIESRSDWQFIAPVYTNPLLENSTDSPFTLNPVFPELIGYVQVIKDKKILHKVTNDILKSNFLINILLCASLLGLMMFITGRVSRPINLLAQTMRQGISGRSHVRVMVSGPRDIAEMQNVFNQMMEVLEACELELKKTRDAALESARIKGEFAFIVTHELRTPLNGVLGMLEILQNMELTEKQKNYVGIAKESGESLLELVNDILDFSRYEAGKMDASAQDFDLRCMLDNIIGLAGGKINSENVDIGFFLSADVPRALNADASRLKQVLLNLVGNAAKFTKQGEISISAERTQHIVGDGFFLRFEVSDTGIGIPEQVHAQIFEPFQQADASTTRSYGGSGLGLAICKQIVEAHGGEIGLRSTLGEGSTFWFTFPVSSAAQAVSPIVVADHALQGQRVLMAEPSAVIRKHVTQICEDWGVQVKTAVTLQQMLDMLASADHPFDLVLVAAGMKGPQGKTLESLLAIEPLLFHTPLIILGQMAAAEEHHAKIRAVVDKPIRVALLHKALTDSLGAEAAPVAQASAVQGATDETKGRISNVLVVEDNRANQIVVSSMLERLGLCATIASNGIEALALIEKHRFDVILMDCNMPEMDGIETTHRIRNLPSDAAHTPIIAMTANAAEIYMERCLAAGMNDCISKPTKLSVLQDKLLSGTLPSIQAVPNSDEEPALDEEVLEELKTAIGDALPRLLTVFAEDLSVYLEKMRQALNEGMASQIHSIAHTIKGSAGNIGAKRVAEVCKRIETAVHGADLGAVRALYTLVVSESERLIALIKQRIEVMTQEESHDELAKSASVQKEQAVASSILIVDDDRSTRMSMRDILKQEGYQIIEAEDGKNALELCGAHPPDLILMDANMPVMDGFTTCRLIKHQKALAHIPVLIVTGLEDESSIERAFAAGATDYVSKPVNYSVLRRRITHLMSASRAEMRMKQLAYNDSLTGLPNRMQFTNHINHLLAEENPLAVMFIDVDRFKLINDTLGHDTGDMLLKIVAERLLGCVREDDLVARLGGDEFTIVTKNVESREVIAGIARK